MKLLSTIPGIALLALLTSPVQARPLTLHQKTIQLNEWRQAFSLGLQLAIQEGEIVNNSKEHQVWAYVLYMAPSSSVEAACDVAGCDPKEGHRLAQKGRNAISNYWKQRAIERNIRQR